MGAQLPSDMYMSAYNGRDSYEKKMAPSAFGYDIYQFTTVCIIIVSVIFLRQPLICKYMPMMTTYFFHCHSPTKSQDFYGIVPSIF